MKFSHFHEVVLHEGWFFIVTGLMGLSMQTLNKQDCTELSWRNNVYSVKFSVNTRLQHAYPIE